MNADQKKRIAHEISNWNNAAKSCLYPATATGDRMAALLQELIDAPEVEPVACDLRMNAYYYCFDKTGILAIDRILSAIACAGKAYHHTECWNDETTPYTGHVGTTPVEWIQNAANDAAKAYTTTPSPSVPDMPLSMEQFGGLVGLARDDASEKAIVYKATNIYGETCYFGVKSTAQAWAKSGNVDEVRLRDLRVVATPAPPESPADLVRDAERLEFLLPVVTGDDSHDAIVRTTAIAAALLQGFSGRAAIDAAIRARGEKGQS